MNEFLSSDPRSAPRAAEAVVLSRREALAVAALAGVPIPLLSLAAAVVPLPQMLERAAASFVPFLAPTLGADEGRIVRERATPGRPLVAIEAVHDPSAVSARRPTAAADGVGGRAPRRSLSPAATAVARPEPRPRAEGLEPPPTSAPPESAAPPSPGTDSAPTGGEPQPPTKGAPDAPTGSGTPSPSPRGTEPAPEPPKPAPGAPSSPGATEKGPPAGTGGGSTQGSGGGQPSHPGGAPDRPAPDPPGGGSQGPAPDPGGRPDEAGTPSTGGGQRP
jgi:translation initiation factor IF-2